MVAECITSTPPRPRLRIRPLRIIRQVMAAECITIPPRPRLRIRPLRIVMQLIMAAECITSTPPRPRLRIRPLRIIRQVRAAECLTSPPRPRLRILSSGIMEVVKYIILVVVHQPSKTPL
jgi:hypothetical protein